MEHSPCPESKSGVGAGGRTHGPRTLWWLQRERSRNMLEGEVCTTSKMQNFSVNFQAETPSEHA